MQILGYDRGGAERATEAFLEMESMFDADGKFRGDPTQLDRIEELAAWHQMDCETHLEDKDALASTIGTVVGTVVAAVATVALTVVTGGTAAAALVPMFTAWGMGTAAATTASAMAVAAGTAMLSTAAEKITVAMIKGNRYDPLKTAYRPCCSGRFRDYCRCYCRPD